LLVSKQADAQASSVPRVSALNARETDDRHGFFDRYFGNNFLIILFPQSSFDFCTAEDGQSPVENLGQVVFGERIRPSPYKVDTKFQD